MNKDHPNILLIGAGAIGTYFTGRLSQAGAKVSVVCRSDYQLMKEKKIFDVKSKDGDFKFTPEQILKSAAEYQEKADYVFVAMKSLPEIDSPKIIKDAVSSETSIVLVQNGIDIESKIAEAFPENELISAVAYIGVTRKEAGVIEHKGGGHIKFGVYPKGTSEKTAVLRDLYQKAGLECEASDDIEFVRWTKLVWNAPFNSISVLGRADTKQIITNPETSELVRKLMEEVCAAAEANGHKLPESIIEDNIEYTQSYPPYKTSMLIDYENGRPLEIEAIVGNTIKAAQAKGVSVPHLESIYALLKLAESKSRSAS
jgi:2-dehydropantoate 2-reductase